MVHSLRLQTDIKIYKEDIDTIDHKLNDTVLISFVKKLLKAESCENKTIFLTNNQTINLRKGGKIKLGKRCLDNYEYIIGIDFIEDISHWCLLFVCFKTGEIFYLDPLTNDNKYELTLVFKNVTKYLSSFKAFKEKTWKISDLCYTHTCQDDTISCGVYVCFFVEKLVKRQKELLSDHVYPNEYRNFIKDFLIN